MKRGSPPDLIRQAWEADRFTLVSSSWQLTELRRASRYPRLKPYLEPHEVGRLVLRLKRRAEVLDTLPQVEHSDDPDDNPLLATAIAGEANVLVTGDKSDLIALGKIDGIPLVTVRAFLTQFL